MFNDGFPLCIFRCNEVCEFFGVHWLRQETITAKTLVHVRQCDGGDNGLIQLCYHLIGQLGGAGKREPSVVQKLRMPELLKSWQVRKISYSFGRSNSNAEQRICVQES